MKRIPGVRPLPPPPRGQELDEEFAFHLDMRQQRLVAAGWSSPAARAEAERQFGNLDDAAAYCRDVGLHREARQMRSQFIREFGADLRYAARALRKAPGFLVVAVLTLALGVGANVAVFAMLRGVLIRPIPVPRTDRLVALFQFDDANREPVNQISYGDYVDLRARTDLFESVALIENASATVIDSRGADRVSGRRVSPEIFPLLGIKPMLGRVFRSQDDRHENVAVLSYDYWAARLASDSSIVGKTIRLDTDVHTVLGVLSPGVDLPYPSRGTQIWLPLVPTPDRLNNRQYWGYWAIARPSADVTPQRLQGELNALARVLQIAHPESNAGRGFTTRDLARTTVGERRPAMMALAAGAMLVLLIACTNLTNLLLARALGRTREFAIRSALGSGVRRLVRALAAETILLAALGGVAGAALAGLLLRVVNELEVLSGLSGTGGSLALSAALAMSAGLACAVWPVLATVRGVSPDGLRAASRSTSGVRERRATDALVASEVALAFVLLVGAALMFATVGRALAADIGFDRRNTLAFRVFPPRDRYSDLASTIAFLDRASAAVSTVPGVAVVTIANALPLGNRMGSAITRQDRPTPPGASAPDVVYAPVAAGYFRAMGIPIVAGRGFEMRDLADSGHVAIISRRTAAELFGGENPIGKRIMLGVPSGTDWHEVVGVVGDVRQDALTGPSVRTAYVLLGEHWGRSTWIIVRTTASATSLVTLIRSRLRDLDPEVPMYEIATMEERASASIGDRRFLLRLLAVFSGIAIVLCAVGIFAVAAQSVGQRRRELGIRMALGATGEQIRRDVLGRTGLLGAIGLAAGVVGAMAFARVLRSLLYGVRATEPALLVGGATLLAAVTLLAAWYPAHRASRVDPLEVMGAD